MSEIVVLGTAQDGGLPHAGCRCAQCERARVEPGFRRTPASLGIRAGGETILIDATSAVGEQMHLLQSASPDSTPGARYQPPPTILLTHAHTGHYVGLWQLDKSVMAANLVRVNGPPLTIQLLAANEPWRQMVEDGFISLSPLPVGEAHNLTSGLSVVPIPVPHRSEWRTDTVAYRIDGPTRSVLYLPDIDRWDDWDFDPTETLGSVDVALIDGTFWEPFTRPGVPHPPVTESLDRFEELARSGRTRIVFTHLNHSNPLVDPASAEAATVRERGFEIAQDGDVIGL